MAATAVTKASGTVSLIASVDREHGSTTGSKNLRFKFLTSNLNSAYVTRDSINAATWRITVQRAI